MSRLLLLYPNVWRHRYGEELASLLEERPPTLVDRLDLVRGAFDAHRHPELVARAEAIAAVPASPEDLRLSRRLGFAALAGAVAWIAAWVVQAFGPIVVDPGGYTYRDGAAALPVLFLAAVLLVAGLLGQLVALPRSARLARAGVIIAIPAILLWSLGPWTVWFGAAALAGLALLALGGMTARVWPAAAGAAVVVMIIAMPMLVLGLIDTSPTSELTPGLLAFITLPLLGWVAVGATLVWPRQRATERL